MNTAHLWHTFKKDGLELLRDKRTLFVNIILPVLLYPVLGLLMVQLAQLKEQGSAALPKIALINTPEDIKNYIPIFVEPDTTNINREITESEKNTPVDSTQSFVEISTEEKDRIIFSDTQSVQAQLQRMREQDLTLVLVGTTGTSYYGHAWEFTILADNAHRHYSSAHKLLKKSLKKYNTELLSQRLETLRLEEKLLTPITHDTTDLAPQAEQVRTKLAGIIPILLVIMALSGAFIPALDLIAGERERGTLETLLSLPGNRTSIFSGKLLVVSTAALVTIILNLLSLAITFALIGNQLAAESGGTSSESLLSIDAPSLAISFIVLIPITVTLSAVSLALAGLAKSFKEAQNYLSPLFIAVLVPSLVCVAPAMRPTWLLDLVPIAGPMLVLKECLQSQSIPVLDVLISSLSSFVLASIIVASAVRLLDDESFLYPGLRRNGWGRFARHLTTEKTGPGGLEAFLVFAGVFACFMFVSGWLTSYGSGSFFSQSTETMKQIGETLPIALALFFGVGLPTLIYIWLGNYSAQKILSFKNTSTRNWLLAIPLMPLSVVVSLIIGGITMPLLPNDESSIQVQEQMQHLFATLNQLGGLPLMLFCIAIAPGICEEILFRGPILQGMRKSLGTTGGILISSFLFAAMHMSPHRFFPQFVLGVILAILTIRCRSILPAILFHATHNGIVVIIEWIGQDKPELQNTLQELDHMQTHEIPNELLIAGIFIALTTVIAVPTLLRAMKPPEEKETVNE